MKLLVPISEQKKAVTYTRVSTDEQAEKGYSLRDQEERINKHCEKNEIEYFYNIS